MRCPDCFEKYGIHKEMMPIPNSCGCPQQRCPRCGKVENA